MADYKKMYTSLFNDVTDVINILEAAQRRTEDIFIETDAMPVECIKKPGSNVMYMKERENGSRQQRNSS